MLVLDEFALNLLLEEGRLTPEQMQHAKQAAALTRTPVTEVLVRDKALSARELAAARAVVCEVPFVDPDHYEIDVQLASLLPRSLADKAFALPLFVLGNVATVGMADPMDLAAVDRVRSALHLDVSPVLVDPGQLRALIERSYSLLGARSAAPAAEAAKQAKQVAADAQDPIISAVNQIITRAIEEGASDIHLSPDESELYLRYRIDGGLVVRQGPPLSNHAALVQRLKVMANLDLTQARRPQDGKFRFTSGTRSVDVRMSTIPTICGENVVLRLLAGSNGLLGIGELGFSPAVAERFTELVGRAHGMFLTTGPTGSGKTTTLYTALKQLNTPDRNCVSIEDPVEIRLPMVRHVQVNPDIGLTFASALRSILRQDPDVVLVGEIRDEETARIAVQAALTGHMVLSTLHTNDAPGAIARLVDFQCPTFAINSALTGVLAQRLIRRVCGSCAAVDSPELSLIHRFCPDRGEGMFRRGRGCPQCSGTGYRGRLGAYELMPLDADVRSAIEHGASTAALRKVAIRQGMRALWADATDKALLGLTTLEEVARIASGMEQADIAGGHSTKKPSGPNQPTPRAAA